MKCSICDKEIPVKEGGWDSGNNAQPVSDGRCCDDCNMEVVVPTRLAAHMWRLDSGGGNESQNDSSQEVDNA